MTSLLSHSQLFPIRTDVLSSGKAPANWKRELSRETDQLAIVLRICGWVKAVAEVHPSLLEQPLLGRCLAEMTSSDVSQPDVTATETARTKRHLNQPAFGSRSRKSIEVTAPSLSHSSRASVSTTANVSELPQSMDQPAETPQSRSQRDRSLTSPPRRQSDDAARLPAQAGGSLLKRLAGAPAAVSEQQANSANRLSSLPRHGRASSPVWTSSLEQHDWRQLVANRATKTWLRDWPSRGVSLNAPEKMPGPHSSAGPLEVQWTTVLSGEKAAPQMLRRLATQSVVGVPDVSKLTRSKVDSPGTQNSFSALSSHTPSPGKRELRNEELELDANPFEGIVRGRDRRDRSVIQESDQAFHTHSQPDADAREHLASAKRFAPPSLAPSMPQLLPPVGPATPSLPIAAETARHSAWRDEANARDKDLSLLAAQVKQILDEEARRHGIDV